MNTSVEWMIFLGRRSTRGHRTVGGEKEDRNNRGKTSDVLYEKQKHGRIYGYTALRCLDRNINNNDNFIYLLSVDVFTSFCG